MGAFVRDVLVLYTDVVPGDCCYLIAYQAICGLGTRMMTGSRNSGFEGRRKKGPQRGRVKRP